MYCMIAMLTPELFQGFFHQVQNQFRLHLKAQKNIQNARIFIASEILSGRILKQFQKTRQEKFCILKKILRY